MNGEPILSLDVVSEYFFQTWNGHSETRDGSVHAIWYAAVWSSRPILLGSKERPLCYVPPLDTPLVSASLCEVALRPPSAHLFESMLQLFHPAPRRPRPISICLRSASGGARPGISCNRQLCGAVSAVIRQFASAQRRRAPSDPITAARGRRRFITGAYSVPEPSCRLCPDGDLSG